MLGFDPVAASPTAGLGTFNVLFPVDGVTCTVVLGNLNIWNPISPVPNGNWVPISPPTGDQWGEIIPVDYLVVVTDIARIGVGLTDGEYYTFLTTAIPERPAGRGDIDGNGTITVFDALNLAKYGEGLPIQTVPPAPSPAEVYVYINDVFVPQLRAYVESAARATYQPIAINTGTAYTAINPNTTTTWTEIKP